MEIWPLPAPRPPAETGVPTLTSSLSSARVQLHCRKEIRDLYSGRLRTVGTVHGVRIDALCEVGADRTGRSLAWVGCAHEIAILQDRIFAFKDLHDHRARDHELHQVGKKRALAM